MQAALFFSLATVARFVPSGAAGMSSEAPVAPVADPDAALVAAFARGDARAFEKLYSAYKGDRKSVV